MWKDRRKRQKPLGSLSQTPEKAPDSWPPCLLRGQLLWTVEFSQDRLLPTGLGFSILPHPPRTEPPGAGGSDKEKWGFCPRGAVFSRSPLTLREMCSELGVPELDPSLCYSFSSPRLVGPVSLNFDYLAPEPWLIAGLVGCLGLAHPHSVSSPPPPQAQLPSVESLLGLRRGWEG